MSCLIKKIRILILNLKSSSVFKSLCLLVSGSAIAQALGICAAPILSRLYSPEHFGVAGTLLAIIGVLSTVSTLSYEKAMILEPNDVDCESLSVLCLRVLAVTTISVSCFVYLIVGSSNVFSLELNLLELIIYVVPGVLFTGLYKIYRIRSNRNRDYKILSLALILRRASLVGTQLIASSFGAFGLVGGNIMGVLAAVIFLHFKCKRKTQNFKNVTLRVSAAAKKHYRFAVYSTPQNLISAISSQMPVFILAYVYDSAVVGAYFFAMCLLQLPAALIGESLREVFYREVADIRDNTELVLKLYKKFTYGLIAMTVLPTLFIFTFGSEIFVWIFGAEWQLAGDFTEWMVLWIGGAFINPPAMALFSVFSAQRLLLIYDVVLAIMRVLVLFLVPSLVNSAEYVIAIYSTVSLLAYLIIIFYWFLLLKHRFRYNEITSKNA